jgi:hypothetical protein
LCAVTGCPREIHDGDLCNTHHRIKAEGLPMAESVAVARRLANTRRVGDCLIWQGAPNNRGYGKVSVRNDPSTPGNEEGVHRWFYKRFVGPIPEGLVLDHLCRTPLCVNVKHLEPVTRIENDRRGLYARGFGPTRTHCVNGHPWKLERLRVNREGAIYPNYTCKDCDIEQQRKKRVRRGKERAA